MKKDWLGQARFWRSRNCLTALSLASKRACQRTSLGWGKLSASHSHQGCIRHDWRHTAAGLLRRTWWR